MMSFTGVDDFIGIILATVRKAVRNESSQNPSLNRFPVVIGWVVEIKRVLTFLYKVDLFFREFSFHETFFTSPHILCRNIFPDLLIKVLNHLEIPATLQREYGIRIFRFTTNNLIISFVIESKRKSPLSGNPSGETRTVHTALFRIKTDSFFM